MYYTRFHHFGHAGDRRTTAAEIGGFELLPQRLSYILSSATCFISISLIRPLIYLFLILHIILLFLYPFNMPLIFIYRHFIRAILGAFSILNEVVYKFIFDFEFIPTPHHAKYYFTPYSHHNDWHYFYHITIVLYRAIFQYISMLRLTPLYGRVDITAMRFLFSVLRRLMYFSQLKANAFI